MEIGLQRLQRSRSTEIGLEIWKQTWTERNLGTKSGSQGPVPHDSCSAIAEMANCVCCQWTLASGKNAQLLRCIEGEPVQLNVLVLGSTTFPLWHPHKNFAQLILDAWCHINPWLAPLTAARGVSVATPQVQLACLPAIQRGRWTYIPSSRQKNLNMS